MLSPSYLDLTARSLASDRDADAPQIVDVRRRDIYEQSPHLLPGARWREPANCAATGAARSTAHARSSSPARPAMN